MSAYNSKGNTRARLAFLTISEARVKHIYTSRYVRVVWLAFLAPQVARSTKLGVSTSTRGVNTKCSL